MMNATLSSPKVIIPSALFALLSPGLILQMPDKIPFMTKGAIGTMKTSQMAVMFHALVFIIIYKLVAGMRGIILKPADMIVPTVLFILLSPGFLLSIPPEGGALFRSGSTSYMQILVHALVFSIVFAFLRSAFPKVY